MKSRTMWSAVVAILMLLSAALPAAAQPNPRGDITGSWGLLATSELAVPAGWVAAVGGRVNSWLTIAGEAGGNYKSASEAGVSVDVSEHAFHGGASGGAACSGGSWHLSIKLLCLQRSNGIRHRYGVRQAHQDGSSWATARAGRCRSCT
jgi:hypothetical protein